MPVSKDSSSSECFFTGVSPTDSFSVERCFYRGFGNRFEKRPVLKDSFFPLSVSCTEVLPTISEDTSRLQRFVFHRVLFKWNSPTDSKKKTHFERFVSLRAFFSARCRPRIRKIRPIFKDLFCLQRLFRRGFTRGFGKHDPI